MITRAQGADDPPSAYANDPFNRTGAGLVLALQWTLEPWTVRARVDRARAEADKAARAVASSPRSAPATTRRPRSPRRPRRTRRSTAAADGEKAARAWLASVLQADAIGAAEAKDLADAYIAWFQMRARWAQAVFQWNVAVVRARPRPPVNPTGLCASAIGRPRAW